MADPITIYIDGGSRGNPGPAAFGVRVEDADGELVTEFSESIGVATNNVAEYRGLLASLQWALEHGHRRVHVRSDSELLVKQMRGEYRVNHPSLQPLHAEARLRAARLESVRFEHVPRERNADADRLANEAMDAATGKPSRSRAKAERELRPGSPANRSADPTATAPADRVRTPRAKQLEESLAPRRSDELSRVLERFTVEARDAVRRQDAAAMAAWFAADAVLLVPGSAPLTGRAAVEAFYAACFGPPSNVRDVSFAASDVEVGDHLAVETGTITVIVQLDGQPGPTTRHGKYLAVWKRQEDGAWLLWRYASSDSAPGSAAGVP